MISHHAPCLLLPPRHGLLPVLCLSQAPLVLSRTGTPLHAGHTPEPLRHRFSTPKRAERLEVFSTLGPPFPVRLGWRALIQQA